MNPTLTTALWPSSAQSLLARTVLVLAGTLLLAVSARVQVPFWPVPMTLQTPMQAFLQQCDLIKFAAQGADMALCNSLLDRTRELVEQAARIPAPQASNGSDASSGSDAPTGDSTSGSAVVPVATDALRQEAGHDG